MKKIFLVLTLILILQNTGLAQYDAKVDSLRNLLSSVAGEEKVTVLRDLCYYNSFINFEESVQFGQDAVSLALEIDFKRGLIGAYNDLATAYLNAGRFETALDYGQKALSTSRQVQNLHNEAASLHNVGVAYSRQGDYLSSLEHLFEALAIKDSLGGAKVGSTLNAIGEVYRLKGAYDKALEYYFQSLEAQQKAGNKQAMAYSLNNIAIIYRHKGDFEKALTYRERSMTMNREMGNDFALAVDYNNLGELYNKKEEPNKSLEHFKRSLALKEGLKNEGGIAHTTHEMARVYAKMGNFKNANREAQRSLGIAKSIGDLKKQMDVSLTLSEIYKQFGRHSEALVYFTAYDALKDSIFREKQAVIMADLETKYQVNKKEAENKLLKLETERQEATIAQKNMLMTIFIIVLSFIALVSVLLFRLYRQKAGKNRQLALQKEELAQLNATKDRFFGIVAHDLRNPVTSFQGVSKLINNYLHHGKTDRIEGLAEKIDHAAENLNRLLDNLLNWAASQTGTLPYHPDPLHLHQVLEETFSLFREAAAAKNIELKSAVMDNPVVYADKNGVSAIFRNLVSNALKFTGEGGKISVKVSRENDQVRLTVSDNGMGMDQNKVQSLFKLSQHDSTDGTSGEKGSGLGLILCKEFAELNKGKIWAQSELNGGTQIHVTLPAYR